MTALTDPAVVREAWRLRDLGYKYKQIEKILQVPVPTIGIWVRERARIERKFAQSEEKAARDARTQQRRAEAVKKNRDSHRVPEAGVAEIRGLYAEVETIAPGFVARKITISALREQFGISDHVLREIVQRKGDYKVT